MFDASKKFIYKKKWCKFKNCKYSDQSHLCRFAHYEEEFCKKPIFMKIPHSKNFKYCIDYLFYNECHICNHFEHYKYCNINKYSRITENIIDNTIGIIQLLNKYGDSFFFKDKILSYLKFKYDCNKCNWCKINYSNENEQIYITYYKNNLNFRSGVNPFLDINYKNKCNIGPICIKCALYKIPIRCEICNNYINSNNIDFKYNILFDIELIKEYKKKYINIDVETIILENSYKKSYNMCIYCILNYYDEITQSIKKAAKDEDVYIRNIPYDLTEFNIISLLEIRYGRRVIHDLY